MNRFYFTIFKINNFLQMKNAGEDEEDGYSSSVSTADSSINTINIPSDNEEDADTLYENLVSIGQTNWKICF